MYPWMILTLKDRSKTDLQGEEEGSSLFFTFSYIESFFIY